MLLCHLLRVAARLELCGIILLCYSMFLIMISDLVCWFVSLILCPPARDPSSVLMFLSALEVSCVLGIKKQTNKQPEKKIWEFRGKEEGKVREGEIQVYVEKYEFFSYCLKSWGRALKINSSLVFWLLFWCYWSAWPLKWVLPKLPGAGNALQNLWDSWLDILSYPEIHLLNGGEGIRVWSGKERNRVGPPVWKPQHIEAGPISRGGWEFQVMFGGSLQRAFIHLQIFA